jgi:uncharacterized protein with ParB-like and HNH nuclease domain
MSFNAQPYTVSDLLANKVTYEIPRNQRKYVWTEINWRDLFEDVLFSLAGRDNVHFIGSIVLKEKSTEKGLRHFEIIDGQQRMLTISILLAAIVYLFKKKGLKKLYEGAKSYLIATNNQYEEVPVLNEGFYTPYHRLLNGITKIGEDELQTSSLDVFINGYVVFKNAEKPIGDCFKYFCLRIEEQLNSVGQNEDFLSKLRDAILSINYVNIVGESTEDAYTIFEILNARGQELLDSDLLKNHIMRYIQPVGRRDEVKKQWEEIEKNLGVNLKYFIKHYAAHKYKNFNQKKKEPYICIKENTNVTDVNDLFEDLCKKASYYEAFCSPSKCEPETFINQEVEFPIFSFFKAHKFQLFRPVLISLVDKVKCGLLDERTYINTLEYLYHFFIGYTIIGKETSNRLMDAVYKYAPLIENSTRDLNTQVSQFRQSLKQKLPTLVHFLNAFKNLGYSHQWDQFKDKRDKERVEVTLETLERSVGGTNIRRNTYSIEHVFPDADSIENSQIGNLLLLEETLNQRCGDKPLEQKIPYYKQSNFSSTRRFAERYERHNFDINGRTEYLAKYFYKTVLEY